MSDSPDGLYCEICQFPFDRKDRFPLMLKECGHTVCEECAETMWNSGKRRRITCPFDRIITEIEDVKNLPKNFSLERLLPTLDAQPSREIKSEPIDSVEIIPGKCVRNSNHEAWFTCLDCKADFCESCFDRKHGIRGNDYANHKKIPTINKSFQPPKCKKHPTKIADFICQDSACQVEDKVVCNTCLRKDHKGHEHGRLEEVVAENEKKLKEELCKRAVSEETKPYLNFYIPKIIHSYDFDNYNSDGLLYNIKCHYDNQHAEAIKKLKKYTKKTFVSGKKLVAEYEEATKTNEALLSIRSEIRGRLASKRKLEDVEDVVKRHKTAHEELNRKRNIPIPSLSHNLKLKLPVLEIEISDPELPNTSVTYVSDQSSDDEDPEVSDQSSDDEDSDQPGTSGISYTSSQPLSKKIALY